LIPRKIRRKRDKNASKNYTPKSENLLG